MLKLCATLFTILSHFQYSFSTAIIFLAILYPNLYLAEGRAIAQAVTRRLPTAAVRVQTRVWSCGIL
jgi:hypothetical protein